MGTWLIRAALLASAATIGSFALEQEAHASPEQDVAAAVAVAGAVGGLVASTAALVYLVQGRSFGSGWVVVSFFSSAICAASAVALAQVPDTSARAVALIMAVLAGWPLAFTTWSALSGVAPGEPFDSPPTQPGALLVPARPAGIVAPLVLVRF